MRISMRADYGVRAMTDLAIHAGQGPVQSADIARRMIVPPVYLDQVMGGLRKAGLVRSTRGPQGGHQLARPPETISLANIVLALEGPFSLLDCLDDVAAWLIGHYESAAHRAGVLNGGQEDRRCFLEQDPLNLACSRPYGGIGHR